MTSDETAPATVTSEGKASGLVGRTVLVADDDAAVLKHVRVGLGAQGYRFVEAKDGAEVLALLKEHQPDLLLLDVEMPRLGGVDVCRIVKANQAFGFIPVLLMTARTGPGKIASLELGADDYLVKPFDMLELGARVKSMLRLKGLQDALITKNRELDLANRELEQKRRELLVLSRTDDLTGLYNRRSFEEQLATEFNRAKRYQKPMSCMLLDIDHFKRINDSFGHPFGDTVLKGVATAAKTNLRELDIIARYGGEELVALLPETPLAVAGEVAARVHGAIARLSFTVPGNKVLQPVQCSVSIGVATFPSPRIESPQALLQAADDCLYAAKNAGRDQVKEHHATL
jgi:diguanylate cyclase (GGDEF)-like protein